MAKSKRVRFEKGSWVELSPPLTDHTGRRFRVAEIIDGRKLLIRPVLPHDSDDWVTINVNPSSKNRASEVPKHRVVRCYLEDEPQHKVQRITHIDWRSQKNPKEALLKVASAEKELILRKLSGKSSPFHLDVSKAQTYIISGRLNDVSGIVLTHDFLMDYVQKLFGDKSVITFNVLDRFKSGDRLSIRFEFIIRDEFLDESY